MHGAIAVPTVTRCRCRRRRRCCCCGHRRAAARSENGPNIFQMLLVFYLAVSRNPSNAQRKSRRKTFLHDTADRQALLINTYSADAYLRNLIRHANTA